MTKLFLIILFLSGVIFLNGERTLEAANCNQVCVTSTDCTQETCKDCAEVSPGTFRCRSCCENDEFDCVSPCYWTGDQCQNVQGVDCSGIPEVPKNSRTIVLMSVLLFVLIAVGFSQRLKKKRLKIE